MGAAFFNLPPTSQGGFTRGGIIFISTGVSQKCHCHFDLIYSSQGVFCVGCLQAFGDVRINSTYRSMIKFMKILLQMFLQMTGRPGNERNETTSQYP